MNTLSAIRRAGVRRPVGDLLGIERLSQYPVLVTICRALNLAAPHDAYRQWLEGRQRAVYLDRGAGRLQPAA